MAEEPKKISFGFSRINKKPVLSLPKKEEKEIQFIECLEENSIKLINGVEKEKELPVIPLKNGNLLRDNMIETLKARKEKKPDIEKRLKNYEESKPLTLDELAAKEILEDLKKEKDTEENQEIRTISKVEGKEVSEKESSLDDYENMPVNQFGLAVLRGMGWAPEKGIGKNAQIIKPVNPILRPKGMGLGADKVIPHPKTVAKEELFMKKGAFLKILSGMHKGLYGTVEGFDELPGRIIVRLALQNTTLSISENLVELVNGSEYKKNSKILNLKEYNNFHEKKEHVKRENSEESSEIIHKEKNHQERNYEKEGKKIVQKSKNKNYDNIKHRNEKKKYKQEYTSSDSDSEKEVRYKSNKYKSSDSSHRSSKYGKEGRVYKYSSDSDSSIEEKKKSKSKKHKHKSSYRSRSRSRSVSKKRKKKRSRHRSR